jgi:hypothetical protein
MTGGDSAEDADPLHHQPQHAMSVIQYALEEAPGVDGKCAAIIAVMRAGIANAETQTCTRCPIWPSTSQKLSLS